MDRPLSCGLAARRTWLSSSISDSLPHRFYLGHEQNFAIGNRRIGQDIRDGTLNAAKEAIF